MGYIERMKYFLTFPLLALLAGGLAFAQGPTDPGCGKKKPPPSPAVGYYGGPPIACKQTCREWYYYTDTGYQSSCVNGGNSEDKCIATAKPPVPLKKDTMSCVNELCTPGGTSNTGITYDDFTVTIEIGACIPPGGE